MIRVASGAQMILSGHRRPTGTFLPAERVATTGTLHEIVERPFMSEVRDNPAMSRFEMAEGDAVAFVAYSRDGNRMVLTHTEVPQSMAGRGIGSKLVHHVLDRLRADNITVVPRCEFVAAYIERQPEYRDLLANPG
jgi:predicted GNAT family acetyltransferase